MKKQSTIISVAVALIAIGGIWYVMQGSPAPISSAPSMLDGFTQCLKDKGAVFYGAFWCPHCQNQKAMFGSSEKLLPYVECSTADGKGQLDVCREKDITGYPTWTFADGSRESGELDLVVLGRKTGCELPKTQ
ncbi:MAG: thioredoxin domain-containing protein [Patescibacteria group bacterium]